MANPYSANDAAIFFQDGVLAELADGSSAKVYLNYPEEVEQFGGSSLPGAVKGMPEMQYATASLTLTHGTVVTIDEVTYKVRGGPRKTGDGVISVADLAKG